MIPFAQQNGRMVSIAEVSTGLACNCSCPSCGQALIARKGRYRIHHFAHYRATECRHALESALHKMSKYILEKNRTIVIPPVNIHSLPIPVQYARRWSYRRADVEPSYHGIVPDILLQGAYQRIAVEIAVHHRTEWNKIYRLQQLHLPAIEIDILPIYRQWQGSGKGHDFQHFIYLLTETTAHKRWLYHPRQHALEHQLRMAAERKRIRQWRRGNNIEYVVMDCPAGKHYWRRGRLEGKAYAYAERDCRQCEHCFEIDYERAHVGYRRIVTLPQAVYCMGKLPKDAAALRRRLLQLERSNRQKPAAQRSAD